MINMINERAVGSARLLSESASWRRRREPYFNFGERKIWVHSVNLVEDLPLQVIDLRNRRNAVA